MMAKIVTMVIRMRMNLPSITFFMVVFNLPTYSCLDWIIFIRALILALLASSLSLTFAVLLGVSPGVVRGFSSALAIQNYTYLNLNHRGFGEGESHFWTPPPRCVFQSLKVV